MQEYVFTAGCIAAKCVRNLEERIHAGATVEKCELVFDPESHVVRMRYVNED